MRCLRIGLSVLVAISIVSTSMRAFAGPGRKVGPPLTPPGQAVESPGKAEGRHGGPVETAPGQAQDRPKKGKQQGHGKHGSSAEGVPMDWPSTHGRKHGPR